MKIDEIETVCFIGAGTMGCFNSLLAAIAGYDAVVYDMSDAALSELEKNQAEMAKFLVASGFLAAARIPEALRRVRIESNFQAAVAHAELVSESVSERLSVKREVHRLLDQTCRQDTLITTNTSSLLVSDIEDVLVYGNRFAALHSHLGARLFDIVGGPRTSPATVELLRRYVVSINGVPLVLRKESPGYVLNAMLGPVLTMAMMLVNEGVAKLEDVDRCWMRERHAPIGPFGLMDLFGLNIIADSWQKPKPEAKHLQGKILGFLNPFIEQGKLGIKTGAGFYNYPEPAYQNTQFLRGDDDLIFAYQALNSVLIESAILIAHNGVASPQEIDQAWTVSMSLDAGPFGILAETGSDIFMAHYSTQVALGLFSADKARLVSRFLQTQTED